MFEKKKTYTICSTIHGHYILAISFLLKKQLKYVLKASQNQ